MKSSFTELLCPAGDLCAFDGAIEGGADAIYLGGTSFNARMNAHNFTAEQLETAVAKAHRYGVKVYLTLNTLVHDREIGSFIEAGKEASQIGVDGVIIADFGMAKALHRVLPDLPLHGSTQMSAHNALYADFLKDCCFTRLVIARETSKEDIQTIIDRSPLEIEVFLHGALCVCHSGQCLFSSMVGGRSGNRGECAQPCRLPYRSAGGKDAYPLSLKDLSLASHIPELQDMGVASLKIEGRMKSAEYVYHTAKIYRRLLDEHRPATKEELQKLSDIFSRNGFTDGYYSGTIGHDMLGVRTQNQKDTTKTLAPFEGITKKIPVAMTCKIQKDTQATLTVTAKGKTVTVTGDIPFVAENRPLTEDYVKEAHSKLGDTDYVLSDFSLTLDDGLLLPLGKIKALRRSALSLLDEKKEREEKEYSPLMPRKKSGPLKTAVCYQTEQITKKAKAYFDILYLPVEIYDGSVKGILLPPVVFPHEEKELKSLLNKAVEMGAEYALVGNIGHIPLVKDLPLKLMGDFRLNIYNNESMRAYEDFGFENCILSPELTLPQCRDIKGNKAVIVYGRLPLMVTEKCVGKELGGCSACEQNKTKLVDRTGATFPVMRCWQHRSLIFNSLPTSMSDKPSELVKNNIPSTHFLFTDESPLQVDTVLTAFQTAQPLPFKVRRI